MLQRARDYFSAQDVLAVDTPALSAFAGTDPNIESLTIRADSGREHFLHTSPEFCMKRLLADGYPDCYSICRVFRGAEAGPRHAPEFTMVEWYRLGFDLQAMIDDTLQFIGACIGDTLPAVEAARFEFAEAFREFAGIDVFTASTEELAARASADEGLRADIGADRDAWLDLLMSTVVAPEFPRNGLTVLQHYPASQAALARLCPSDSRVADRFEVFSGEVELANGYVELTDPVEQRRRIDGDLQARQVTGRRHYPADRLLLGAIEAGLPDCAGVAIGVERLHMVMDKADDIRNVVTFGTELV